MNFMSGLFRANISSSTRWPKTKNISSVSNAGFSSQLAESRTKFTGHSVTRRLPSSFSRCLSNTSSTASASTADSGASMHDKVYELRIYDFKPDFLGDFTKLSNENFHLRTKHSKLLGYWFTEFGGANQVVHIWEYDSFAHRKSVRAALAEDPDWLGKYVSKLTQYLVKQDNVALTLLPWSEVEVPEHEGGIYELCAHTMSGSESKWNDLMRDMLMGKEESHQGTILGAWKAQAGGVMNTVYHLWHYPDLDNRIKSSEEAAQNPDYVLTKEALLPYCSNYWTKILNPAPWSPMK